MRRRRPHEGTDGRGPNPDVIYVWPGRRLARRQQPKAAVSRRARPGQRGWQSRVARERVTISPRPGARRTPRGAAIRVGSGPVAGKLGPQPVTRREAAATKIKAEFNFPVGDASAPGEGSPAGHAMGELRRLRHRGEGRAWHHPGGSQRPGGLRAPAPARRRGCVRESLARCLRLRGPDRPIVLRANGGANGRGGVKMRRGPVKERS